MPLVETELRGRVFTTEEVAALMGLKPDAIRRKIRDGLLKGFRPPGSRVYHVMGDDLWEYATTGSGPRKFRRDHSKASPAPTKPKAAPKPEPPPSAPRPKQTAQRKPAPVSGLPAKVQRFIDSECGGVLAEAARRTEVDRAILWRIVNKGRQPRPDVLKRLAAAGIEVE